MLRREGGWNFDGQEKDLWEKEHDKVGRVM